MNPENKHTISLYVLQDSNTKKYLKRKLPIILSEKKCSETIGETYNYEYWVDNLIDGSIGVGEDGPALVIMRFMDKKIETTLLELKTDINTNNFITIAEG